MRKSKAINLLSTLDKVEFKEFKNYLYQKYKSKKLAVQIFDYYHTRVDLFREQPKLLDLSVAYKKITKQVITEKRKKTFQNAMSALYVDLIDFLLIQEVQKDSFQRDLLLVKIFKTRKQAKGISKIIQQRKQKIEQQKLWNLWSPLQLLQLDHFTYYQENYDSKIADHTAKFEDLMNHLDAFYTTLKLYYSCEMNNRTNIVPENYNVLLIKEVVEILKEKNVIKYPLIEFYHLCLNLSKSQTEEDFIKLQSVLEANEAMLANADKLLAYTLSSNYLIQQIKKRKARS